MKTVFNNYGRQPRSGDPAVGATAKALSPSLINICALSAVAIGFWLRFRQATGTYLNPDEVIFFFAGSADTLEGLSHNIFQTQHAPLFILILHFVEQISSSELALRFVPLIAGSLCPWIVFHWLATAWNRTAGLIALVILTFSPPLLSLSAQARGYTLVLLLAALSLFYLETGIVKRSTSRVVVSAICILLALLTEYSAAFLAGGAGLYSLFRLRGGVPRRLVAVWAIGQTAALAAFLGLYLAQAAPLLSNPENAAGMSSSFAGAYRNPDQQLAVFLASGTVRQFSYALGSHVLGALAMGAFAGGLWRLWSGRRYALIALLSAPIVFAWGGALLSHPFGRSRHTAVLSIVIAVGVAIGLELVLRRRTGLVAIGALALVVNLTGWTDVNDIDSRRHRLESMHAAVGYIREVVPPDGVLLADSETAWLLYYYLRDDQHKLPDWQELREVQFGDLHLVSNGRWDFGSADQLAGDIAWLRQVLGADSKKPIWVADGGFGAGLRASFHRQYPRIVLSDDRDFDGALQVFRLPPQL